MFCLLASFRETDKTESTLCEFMLELIFLMLRWLKLISPSYLVAFFQLGSGVVYLERAMPLRDLIFGRLMSEKFWNFLIGIEVMILAWFKSGALYSFFAF